MTRALVADDGAGDVDIVDMRRPMPQTPDLISCGVQAKYLRQAANEIVRDRAEITRLRGDVERLTKERDEARDFALRKSKEAFEGNAGAVNKLGLNAMDVHPILMAVQTWNISTGRARELIRCWVLGTFAEDMLPTGGEDLGIAEDDDPADVLRSTRARADAAEADRHARDLAVVKTALEVAAGVAETDKHRFEQYYGPTAQGSYIAKTVRAIDPEAVLKRIEE